MTLKMQQKTLGSSFYEQQACGGQQDPHLRGPSPAGVLQHLSERRGLPGLGSIPLAPTRCWLDDAGLARAVSDRGAVWL